MKKAFTFIRTLLRKNLVKVQQGFTLIELLIVMAIMGILATLIVGGFQSAQLRGRDSQRKSDLKQLANSLELFYNDYGYYPADSSGLIVGCPYISGGASVACSWGGRPVYR